jgi:surface protein
MSGGARRPRYRQVMQNSVKNGKWGKAGIMNCQFRSRISLCNSIRSRTTTTTTTTEVVYDAIPNVSYSNTRKSGGIWEIIDDWIAGGVTRRDVEAKYGKIEDWDTSNVTSMKNLFFDKRTFNEDISKWNTSNVTDMGGMFYEANVFTQELNEWNVSKVTKMQYMFYDCDKFNSKLNKWNVSSVTNMEAMFNQALLFNQELSGWKVQKVLSMKQMFYHALAFDQNLSSWEPNVCTDFDGMFVDAFVQTQIKGDWTSTTTFKNTLDNRLTATTPATSVGFFSDNTNYSIGSTGQYPKLN